MQFLDEDGKFFSQRILSRDECFNLTSKKDNLKALFPCGDAMVCIIDDREDVWNMASNLIQVKPYHFFQHTGDINAPQEMSKHELDGTQGVDFKEILSQASKKRKKREDSEREVSQQPKASDSATEKNEETTKSKDQETTVDEILSKNETDNTKSETVCKDTNDSCEKPAEQSSGTFREKESPKVLCDNEENLFEVEDPDDYLLYLEVILKKIHEAFYEIYSKKKKIPDLKTLIPNVKAQVLVGKNLVFSGIVPNHIPLEQSKPYQIAKSLGATVMESIDETTTHMVAACSGTFKVNLAKKNPKIKLVAPEWLWSCAERWETVEEQLFPMPKMPSKMRQPPPHCSPEHKSDSNSSTEPKFMDTINPLLSFSNDELDQMDEEFNEFFNASDSDDTDNTIDIENPPTEKTLSRKRKRLEEKPNASDFFTRPEVKKINLSGIVNDQEDSKSSSGSSEDEMPSIKFRRGENLPSDVEDNSSSKGSNEPPDDVDDGEWNMMGAALEREFLGLDE